MLLFTPLKPMIVSIGPEPFDSDDFLFEPKWDGWRLLLHKQSDRVEIYTRNGLQVTGKFPELKEAASAIKADTAILDGEGIVLRGGRPVFDDFAYRGRLGSSMKIRSAVHSHPVTFVAFDVLMTSKEHMDEPLTERKQRLAELIAPHPAILPTLYVPGQGKTLFGLTKERNMEGIVAKRKRSAYVLGAKTGDWLKMKHFRTIDVIILGYRTKPFALAIGLNFRTMANKPVGVVELGFRPEDKQLLLELAPPLETTWDGRTQWLKPQLCCRIDYLERTDTHQLRTTIFRGFLPGKRPEDCIWRS